ncbi:hypothetical protein QLQ12_34780 [Actinoplanes sp. NEAU-A12]|uniref:Uncharacterized protein n=1 Tax=Actinoplanes sandaracinus TaxID=3045177 RepID=A0ABT6WVL9_9ACTN|nr:hypothetical protein [Actinoplanes sandaracinus]MDI6103792.1 hypothetical protein [Actinoplanes sandaracinus]
MVRRTLVGGSVHSSDPRLPASVLARTERGIVEINTAIEASSAG